MPSPLGLYHFSIYVLRFFTLFTLFSVMGPFSSQGSSLSHQCREASVDLIGSECFLHLPGFALSSVIAEPTSAFTGRSCLGSLLPHSFSGIKKTVFISVSVLSQQACLCNYSYLSLLNSSFQFVFLYIKQLPFF